MEWTPSVSENLPRDVADWHNKEQLAYWKSRALSLEYENRMLMIHLKHVYSTYVSEAAEELEEESKPGPYQRVKEEKVERGKEKEKVEPRLPEGKKRTEEAKRLYGEKNYAKIMGMETAMQLNYDRLCETNKAPYWPNIPINL
ncbi:uncharacterized protein LOC126266190 isoform X2 [Aethina tumida]|nr:uncharacterized protein LOC126266190 isoform X2 [Aethina tumida]